MNISNMLHTISTSLIAGIVLASVAQVAVAESADVTATGDTIIAKHRYTMGDNDSKSDATTICFLEAKRKAIEYAGIYVESTVQITQTDKSRNARSDMKTIAAALVSAEMVSSDTGIDNGKVFVDCVVKAKVNQSQLKQDIARISADPAAKQQIQDQQAMLKKLEKDILKIQTQMASASSQQAVSLRQERTVVFKEIDTLQQKKQEIVSLIESKGTDVQQLITKGMTEEEVESLMGKPRATSGGYGDLLGYSKVSGDYYDSWNYGTRWVIFTTRLVICVSSSANHCD
jgi:hypothetical protein